MSIHKISVETLVILFGHKSGDLGLVVDWTNLEKKNNRKIKWSIYITIAENPEIQTRG